MCVTTKEREYWEATSSWILGQGTVGGGKEILNCGKGRAGDNLGSENLTTIPGGQHFRIRSDQSSLSWIFSASSVDNPRLARFRLKLAGLSFSVFHLPGTSNRVADGLSRCETDGSTVDQPHAHSCDDVPCLLVREMPPRPGPLLEVDE
jgi:hypothetical protein